MALENINAQGRVGNFSIWDGTIEHHLYVVSLLNATLVTPATNEHAVLDALLEIADGSITIAVAMPRTCNCPR